MPGRPVAGRVSSPFRQPVCSKTDPAAAISFMSPKLSLKASLPGSLPEATLVAAARGERYGH